MNIMVKELAPIVISCSVWGPQLAKHSVLFECDNSSVVAALSNGTAKDNAVMHLLRVLWFFIAHYDIELIPKHIPGVSNCTADHLSRNNMQCFFSLNPQASAVSAPIPLSLQTLLTIPGPDWTSSSFKQLFNITITSLAPATHKLYLCGQQRYMSFCQQFHLSPLPTTENTILLFIASLAQSKLAHTTIKAYLSAVRSLHIQSGLLHKFSSQLSPRVEMILRGIKKEQCEGQSPRIQLPITIEIMYKLKQPLQGQPNDYHNLMIWEACCIAFFGFLRCSKFITPSQQDYDPQVHLQYKNVAVDC